MTSGNRTWVAIALCLLGSVALPPAPRAADAEPDLLLGMSTALTGPAAQLGINMRDGVAAALDEANRNGGIRGRLFQLDVLDDGYEPTRTAPNMVTLIEERKALAIVGNVGTPTAVAAIPIANARETVLFGAYSGAGVLRRDPPDRYVINYRASYAEETAAMVNALIEHTDIRLEEIAFFTQRDSYGDSGYSGGIAAMKKHGLDNDQRIVHGRYERNTNAVENGLADIISAAAPIRAVILVGAYEPCSLFIQLARQNGLDWLFLNVSFVGSEPLADALGDEGNGVIITQVVPHPQADLPVVVAYRDAMKARDNTNLLTFGSLEGYIVGRIFVHALLQQQGPLDRSTIVEALESLGEFDIGLGESLALSPENHQACHQIWPTVIRNGAVVPFKWSELRQVQESTASRD